MAQYGKAQWVAALDQQVLSNSAVAEASLWRLLQDTSGYPTMQQGVNLQHLRFWLRPAFALAQLKRGENLKLPYLKVDEILRTVALRMSLYIIGNLLKEVVASPRAARQGSGEAAMALININEA